MEVVTRTFNGRYTINLPSWQRLAGGGTAATPQSSGPGPYEYEPERTASMEQWLRKGDILFDIGASDGWLSAIYAQFVGAENMCIFEPSPVAWPNIRLMWQLNNLPNPRFTYQGFASNETSEFGEITYPWPPVGGEPVEEMQFRGIKDSKHNTPQITIDDFVGVTGVIPQGISIDVEGAEFLVCQGMVRTLKKHRPYVWLSAHTINGAIFYDYGHSLGQIFGLFAECKYEPPRWLEIYGDEHWLLLPPWEERRENSVPGKL